MLVGKHGYWWAMAALVALLLLLYSTPRIRYWPQRVSPTPHLNNVTAIADLLQRQEQGLVSLLNTTGTSAPALLTQIQLNHQMQQLVGSGSSGTDLCRTSNSSRRRLENKLLKWQPQEEKRYLLVVCTSGQISNHIICLEKHMYFAALLNRTLVLPSPALDYDYEKSLDVAHIRACLGAATIVTFAELVAVGRTEMRLLCYMPGCYLDEEHEKKLKSLGLSWTLKTNAWPQEASIKGYPSHPHAAEIVAKFSCPDKVIAVGDLFYADVESELVSQVGGPLQHRCKTIIRPNRLILLTAERFLQTYLGDNFMAIHFRRHGFLKFCNVKNESCFYPIPQAANCISSQLQVSKPRVIYVSTDAAESEINLLQQLLEPQVPMVQRPPHDSKEKWDALLQRKGLLGDNEVIAMLDKTICAMSKVFIGTPGSTFTDDIVRLRREWGKNNSCDCQLCEGQHPSYIAETD